MVASLRIAMAVWTGGASASPPGCCGTRGAMPPLPVPMGEEVNPFQVLMVGDWSPVPMGVGVGRGGCPPVATGVAARGVSPCQPLHGKGQPPSQPLWGSLGIRNPGGRTRYKKPYSQLFLTYILVREMKQKWSAFLIPK